MRLASSPEDWWLLVERCRRVAELTVEDRLACVEAWHQAGRAVECALKALILEQERLAAWPTRRERPELYTHDLKRLFRSARVAVTGSRIAVRGSLIALMEWDHEHRYGADPMELRDVRRMTAAVFGAEGVIAWLKSS